MRIQSSLLAAVVSLVLLAGNLPAQVVITEFMASNSQTLKDDYGDTSDWIEIFNNSTSAVNLLDWALTDNASKPTKWLFPSTNLPPSGYMVVFASGRDRHTAGAPLHTSFKLAASGGYLALMRPDHTIATQFNPYPGQLTDVSYGFGLDSVVNLAVSTNSTGRVIVPANGSLGTNWVATGFSDASWGTATNGVGFETGQSEDPGNLAAVVLADNPAGYWRLGETNGTVVTNSGWIAGTGDGQLVGGVTMGVPGPQPPAWNGFESGNLAARVNGSGAMVQAAYTPDLNPSGAFTVEAWVKPSRKGAGTAWPVSSLNVPDGSSVRSGYSLAQDYSVSGQWEFCLGNGGGYVVRSHGGTVDTNHWQYLAGVYDGLGGQLYVNGVLVASNAVSSAFAPNTSQKFIIGGRINGTPYYYAGDVDEVSVIARNLSAAEIARRYQIATNGIAQTNVFNYTGLIKTDLRTNMFGVNSSAYLRLPFTLTNAAAINGLKLNARYDDGFAAFLNGTLVAFDNAPASLNWDSAATNRRPTADALQFASFDLTAMAGYLQDGANVLALQGLNLSATNPDFLLQAVLEADSNQYSADGRYFIQPTPGAPNTLGVNQLGPIVLGDGFLPALPRTNDSLTVTCRVMQAFAIVTNVTLNWRVMYGALQQTPMYDDGQHGDGAAGDGVYGASITNGTDGNWTYGAGDMVRWYVTATDALSRNSRWPLFTDPVGSAEYDGTVIQADYVTSRLPVFQLFVDPANQSLADSQTGSRASFYYDGEFYDNIGINLRGNSTGGYAKKSHRLGFNDDHQLRHPGPGGRIGNTSLLAEYMDPSYLRQYLSFWLLNLAGVPSAFDYPVRVQRNGAFYQLAFHNNVPGAEELGYLGYDKAGALYKCAGIVAPNHSSSGGFEKLLPKTNLTSTVDFDAMANAIAQTLSLAQRKTNAFDLLNVPEIVNYLATARFNHEADDVWANMTIYRDTFGNGEWSIVPYDLNLSWGQCYYGNAPGIYNVVNATNDLYKSHPLYGGSQVQENGNASWNRIYDIIIAIPETRQMLLRRTRTLLDRFVQPPGTDFGHGLIEQQIATVTNQIWADAQLDRQLWGWPPNGGAYGWGPNLWLTNGVDGLLNRFLNPRRTHFFVTHCATNTSKVIGLTWTNNAGIPISQPTNVAIAIASWDYNPVSGNQDEEFVCVTNTDSIAVDISGWQLGGGVSHQFKPGTVIPVGGALYVSPNVAAFRARALPPHGKMGLFVQGNYNGHLNAWGESLTLTDTAGQLVSSNSFVGVPSMAQRYLRITEIMYNPAPMAGNTNDPQLCEYLELKNISTNVTLNLNGVQMTDGVSFSFTGSAVTNLAPGQTVLLVRDTAAFTARYGSGFLIAGQYTGALDNAGENLRLQDAVGEKILEFSYNNSWYPLTDGLGFSLVIRDENASWDTWGDPASWRASGQLNGSPGNSDPLPAALAPVLVNEALTHSDPSFDWIELYNPTATNVDVSGWLLTDDFYTPKKYQIPSGTVIAAGGYLVFPGETTFETGANGFRLSEYGEEVYLFSGDAATNLTGYFHGFSFGAAPNNVSFGRYVNSLGEEDFVLQSAQTPGTNNALPRVGPVVIAEFMYHPPDLTNNVDDALDEFIELQNITSLDVPMFDTFTNEAGYGSAALTNTWRLRNAVDYDFPTNVTLPANGRLLVVGFDPVTNLTQLAAFQTRYSVPTNVAIYGPWSGKLDNSGETIELKSPDKPDVGATNVTVPFVMIDKVSYLDASPWPTGADGQSNSLQRLVLNAYGNDPTNWVAAQPTPGWVAIQTRPRITAIAANGSSAGVTVATQLGLNYLLEYKDDLQDPDWLPVLPSVAGNGANITLIDTNAIAAKRFYRVRIQ